MTVEEIVNKYPEVKGYIRIVDAFTKATSVLAKAHTIVLSLSGGADSDVMLDLIEKIKRPEHEIHYVFFDTGLELDATKEHITYLEQKYNIQIERVKPKITVPTAVKKYGVPLVNKNVSYNINLLQRNNFKWEDEKYPELESKYPKALTGVKWWSNYYHSEYDNVSKRTDFKPRDSYYNICRNKGLKEQILKDTPDFPVSNKCCYFAKVKPAKDIIKKYNADLEIIGLRKAEGGRRSAMNKCFQPRSSSRKFDVYYPLFWITNDDKREYEEIFNIVHSRCYTEYGFKRTGCVGCPYNLEIEKDLEIIKEHEPKKYKACQYVFGKAYEWQKKYKKSK